MVFRVYGKKGALEWKQVQPDDVIFHKYGEATQVLTRGGSYFDEEAKSYFRLPFGHPEGYYVAEANIYRNIINYIIKRKNGEELTAADMDFPDVETGVSGVRFVHAVMKSGDNDSKWVNVE